MTEGTIVLKENRIKKASQKSKRVKEWYKLENGDLKALINAGFRVNSRHAKILPN